MMVFAEPIAASDRDASPEQIMVIGIVLAAVCLPFMIGCGLPVILPRRKSTWIYALIVIALGLTSACTIFFSVPLLIFWLKEDVKRYYNAL